MSLIDYYTSVKSSTRTIWLWAGLAILAGGAWAVFTLGPMPWRADTKGKGHTYFTIIPTTLEITLNQQGELQSVNNIDINCPVQGQNTIQQIVAEGTFVKKNEVIAMLDSTEHRRTLDTAEIELEKADADVKWASEQLKLQVSSNSSALDAAKSELALANIVLNEYRDGEYPAAVQDAKRKLEMANLSLQRKEEELATAKKLLVREFTTLSEVQKAQLDVITDRNAQEKATSDLELLTKYKHAKDLSEKEDKVVQADKKMARVLNENLANLTQKESDLRAKQRMLDQRKAFAERARKMFDNCTIKAPSDGMVLYASSVSMNYYREQPIGPGAKIFQEQMLVRLPDVSKMKAVVKIAEARVARLKNAGEDVRAGVSIVGVPKLIGAKLSKIGVLPDNTQRYIDPDAKDYPVDLTLDETPPGLKPGASAKVTIYLGKLDDVLAAPIGSIYSVGDDNYVFTRDDLRPRPVKVKLGQANDTMVHITEGITAGQEILVLEIGQGRQLLDAAGIKSSIPLEKEKPGPATQAAPSIATPVVPAVKPAPIG